MKKILMIGFSRLSIFIFEVDGAPRDNWVKMVVLNIEGKETKWHQGFLKVKRD